MSHKQKIQNIENEINNYEEKQQPILNKEDLQNFVQNSKLYAKFFGEVLSEKPESESYPLYFLPALAIVFVFYIFSFAVSYSILQTQYATFWLRGLASLLIATAALSSLILGLKLSILMLKGAGSFQEIFITLSFFCFPMTIGFFLGWLFSYGTWIAGYLVIYLAHSISVVSIYCVLPKTLLLSGIARLLSLAITLASPILAISLVLRIMN
ncbi:MAG: hypothetical protein HUU50_07025 [Candidatus Brocadiae bacterium]|nr:hypothetical protein [Candidatus Brocadiia bacterium]